MKDVTEALRASESTLRSFYESAPIMMGVVEVPADNSDIFHVYDNPATDRFFGRARGSTVGQSALGMGMPEEVVRRWIEHTAWLSASGDPCSLSIRIRGRVVRSGCRRLWRGLDLEILDGRGSRMLRLT